MEKEEVLDCGAKEKWTLKCFGLLLIPGGDCWLDGCWQEIPTGELIPERAESLPTGASPPGIELLHRCKARRLQIHGWSSRHAGLGNSEVFVRPHKNCVLYFLPRSRSVLAFSEALAIPKDTPIMKACLYLLLSVNTENT